MQARPFLLAHYTLSYQTDELHEELVSLGLDMTSGAITPDFLSFLSAAETVPGITDTAVETPSCSLEEAFTLLHRYLEKLVAARDRRWVDEARTRYEEELACLYQYYQEDQRDFADFHSRALDLYDKFRPRVLVRLVNVGLLYLPELVYTLPETGRKKKPSYATYRCWERWKAPVPRHHSDRGGDQQPGVRRSRPVKSGGRATPKGHLGVPKPPPLRGKSPLPGR